MAALLPAMLCPSHESLLLAGRCPVKAVVRRAYGTQFPNRDHLTAWHSPPKPPASGGKMLASDEDSFTQPSTSAAGCAGAGETWQQAVAMSGWVCSWELCWRRAGCPGVMPCLGQALGVLPEGAWVLAAPRPYCLGRKGAACLPQFWGCSSSSRSKMRR